MSLEMFVPGNRLKYLAEGVKQHGIGALFSCDSDEYHRKTLFRSKTGDYWKREIGRAPFQEVGNGHRGASGPII